MIRYFAILPSLFLIPLTLISQVRSSGVVTGRIIERQSEAPVEYANIVLLDTINHTMVTGVFSDSNGYFKLKEVP